MRPASALAAVRQRLGLDPPWWQELCACYGVRPWEARALGRRSPGRRPDFPAGPRGKSYEEIWASRLRETPADIAAFYGELGSWPVFRQAYRHRYRAWPDVARALPYGGVVVEYGCGIAPVAWWLRRRRPDASVVLVDVPGQALTFALWRLARLGIRDPWSCAVVVRDGDVPTLPACDVALVLETLEHVPSPLAVVEAILGALRPGGALFEDFCLHERPSPADLESARRERGAVYELLGATCDRIAGRHWNAPEGGGTRQWRRR